MLSRLKENPHFSHFLLYSVTFFLFGFQITGIGPIIPYLADAYGHKQTEYSFLFTCRSVGMLIGAAGCKFLLHSESRPRHHTMIIFGLVLSFVFMVLFSWSTTLLTQGAFYLIGCIFYMPIEIMGNIGLVLTNPPQSMEFWMLTANGMFGVGALLGPLFVWYFELNAFIFSSMTLLLMVPFCYYLPSPQDMNIQHTEQNQKDEIKPVSSRLEWMLGLLLMIEIGIESTLGGWISTFSILAGVSNKQEATIFVTIFWISMTIMRFGFAYIPGTSSQKMKRAMQLIVTTSLLLLLLIYLGQVKFACYAACVLFGMFMAPNYALVYSIPSEFGFKLLQSQTSTIVLCSQIAEGTMTSFTGKLMEWSSYKMLLYSEIVMAVAMWILCDQVVKQLKREDTANQKELQVELNPVKQRDLNESKQ